MSERRLGIATLNAMSGADFVAALGDIYEHAPWVAEAAASHRPFRDAAALAACMAQVVREADGARQLALLRAHPELGQGGPLAPESAREQRERGIDRLAGEKVLRLATLNAAYRERHGFPFIIAVGAQRDFDAILLAAERRLANAMEEERRIALGEVEKIAALRLARRLDTAREAAAGLQPEAR